MTKRIFLLFCFFLGKYVFAQNTVGILYQDPSAVYEGYNLIFPNNQAHTYLLDNCGQIVHTWEDEAVFRPGNAVYLLENGNLIKCKRSAMSGPNDPIWAGGAGATVECRTWDNQLLHTYTLNDSLFRLHHDIAPLPNGNVLMIAWAYKSEAEALSAGRKPELLAQNKLWSEIILEWNPEQDSIVWQWEAWDHLIQNFNPAKENYGNPANYPELIDLNYDEHNGHPDWLHINAIDYNPVLDQIVLSVPYFNEIWIIDHSTSTQEAASHIGGNSGKGGDLLYRWGNPATYGNGASADRQCYFQHDAKWINPNALPEDSDFGEVSIFNNRLPNNQSSANSIATLQDGEYHMQEGKFLPHRFAQNLIYEDENRAASSSVSSTQFLPNGNALILSGRWGFAYEITPDREVVWEYIVPLKSGQIVPQGQTLDVNNNLTFRMTRYGLDYAAFAGRDLHPKNYWELEPNEGFCGLVATEEISELSNFRIYPNPSSTAIWLEIEQPTRIQIYQNIGVKQQTLDLQKGQHFLDVSTWERGIYYFVGERGNVRKLMVF